MRDTSGRACHVLSLALTLGLLMDLLFPVEP